MTEWGVGFVWAFVTGIAMLAGGPAVAGSFGVLPRQALEELASFVEAQRQAAGVPGLAYVVVQADQVVDARALGVRKLGGGPVTPETVFEIGSTSKAFTASMLAMLVEEGELRWDDRVVDHLPWFRMYDRWVTREARVADLLCQRSGMPEYSLDAMSSLGFERDRLMRALRFVEPVESFRSAYAYQNAPWLLAGAILEQKSGLRWEDNLDRRIFGPLGMAATTTSPEVVAAMANVATGHFQVPLIPAPTEGPKTELQPVPDDWPYRHWLDIYGPAGSIRSTVLDMAQWLRLNINLGIVGETRLLNATSLAYLHAPKTLRVADTLASPDGNFNAYASGWMVLTARHHLVVLHPGATTGMHALVGFIPETGAGMVMLTNAADNQVPEASLGKLLELLLASPVPAAAFSDLGGRARLPVLRPGVGAMGPPLSLERYVGSYTNPAYGSFEVRVRKGSLELVFGPRPLVGVLEPVSGNTFTMRWPGWPAQVSTVTFTVPTGRPAGKMTISTFEDVKGGEFERLGAGTGH